MEFLNDVDIISLKCLIQKMLNVLVYIIPVPGLPPIAVLPRIPEAVPGGRAAPPAVPGGLRPWLVLNACCNSIDFNI